MMQLISSVKRRMGQSSREGHHTSQPDHAHVATPTAQQTFSTRPSFIPLNSSTSGLEGSEDPTSPSNPIQPQQSQPPPQARGRASIRSSQSAPRPASSAPMLQANNVDSSSWSKTAATSASAPSAPTGGPARSNSAQPARNATKPKTPQWGNGDTPQSSAIFDRTPDLLQQDSFGAIVKSCDMAKPSEELRPSSSPFGSSPSKKSSDCQGLLVRKASPDAFAHEPHLREVPNHEVLEVLRRKMNLCASVIFDFKQSSADLWLDAKEAKKATLNEILDFVQNSDRRSVHLEQVVEELIEMISANIFRPLPPSASTTSSMLLNDPEELEPILEVSWPHLSLVYEILLKFVMSNEVNPKTTKKYIDHAFVLKLLELFASEDPRERDYLKTIMHRVYGKIMALRAFIRKAIQHVFFRYVHEDDSQHGVSELLEILGSIINGFAQPLKEEHKLFLKRSMIPLHKSRHLVSYHQQLTYCMTQYIEKDNKLVEPIIRGLLRYWPVTNTPKEVLFLNEVEEILELTPPPEFVKIMEPLFQRMAMCIQSPHFQVSERVLFLWNNTRIVKLINANKEQLFPIVIGALYKNTKDHWNVTVHGLTFNVCKLLAEADPHLFDHVNDENLKQQERKRKERERRRMMWQSLKRTAEEGDAAVQR